MMLRAVNQYPTNNGDSVFDYVIVGEAFMGLGSSDHFDYSYWSGSGDCERLRMQAAANLEGVISKYAVDGALAHPDSRLIAIVKDIAAYTEESRYSMRNTYDAVRDVVAIHGAARNMEPTVQAAFFEQQADALAARYGVSGVVGGTHGGELTSDQITVIGKATALLKEQRAEREAGGGQAISGG